ncbi:MAG: 5-formyltetrahydrofolate cyclo-ligase [Pseudomonadota bacterium]|nr:5-formyltetrahydrofolate cyclo-ligase [Pseudomonadota bacterium]
MNDHRSATRQLRKELRARRRRLSRNERQQAARDLARILRRLREFGAARSVAFYISRGGEIDPAMALQEALRAGKRCYLPVLSPARQNRLYFSEVTHTSRFRDNCYGIPEPQQPRRRWCSAAQLDLILLPLVAFDAAGNRIGMGGGYYDATLAFRRCRSRYRRPYLIGLAHDFQRVDSIQSQPWDVPLDGVMTDGEIYRPSNEKHKITAET